MELKKFTKKSRKKEKEQMGQIETNSKKMHLNTAISVIILAINYLNALIIRQIG